MTLNIISLIIKVRVSFKYRVFDKLCLNKKNEFIG